MKPIARLLALCVALLLVTAPAQAQVSEAIDLVPADSLGFLMIKDLRQFSDKIEQTAKKLGVGESVSFLELIKKELGIAEGINDHGSAVFIITKAKDAKSYPDVIVALPIADRLKIAPQVGLKELAETVADGQVGSASGLLGGVGGGLGKEGKAAKFPVSVARRGNFLLVTQRNGTFWDSNAKEALRLIVASKQSLKAALQPAQAWLDEQDLAGIVTDKGVSHGLGLTMAGDGGAAGSDTKGQAEQLKATFADLEKNVNLIAFGGKIEDNLSWRLSTALHFKADGDYAKWIAKAENANDAVLKKFPDAPKFGVAVARISSQFSLDGLAKYMPEKISADQRAALAKEMSKLLQQISDVGVCAYQGASSKRPKTRKEQPAPEDLGSLNPVVIATVRDAATFLDDAVDLLKRARRLAKPAASTKNEVNYQEKDVAGKPSRLLTFTTTEKGKTSTTSVLLTALDDKTVLACAVEGKKPEAIVAQYAKAGKASLAQNAVLQAARALLPAKLQAEVFVDLQTFGFFSGKKKPAAASAPPLAISLRVIPAAVEAQFVIPFDAMKAVVGNLGADADNAQSMNYLKQLGLALHGYHDVYGHLPPPAICDPHGKPLLSWRVAILPYIEQQALYKEFKLDEPWDSAHNKKLLPRMPRVYQLPDKSDGERTHYRVPVGKGAIYSSPSDKVSLAKVADGLSNTILVVETADSVPWTKPEEFDYGPGKLPTLYRREGTWAVLFADGSVRRLPETMTEAMLRAAFTRAGGESVELPQE